MNCTINKLNGTLSIVLTNWDDGITSGSYNFGSASVSTGSNSTGSNPTSSLIIPNNPIRTYSSSLYTSNASAADDRVLFHNKHLFVANPANNTLSILTGSSPTSMSLVATASLPFPTVFLIANGRYLYCGDYACNLVCVDVYDFAHPVVSSMVTSSFSSELFCWFWPVIKNNYLYVAAHYPGGSGEGSILAYNIMPGTPVFIKRWRYPSGSWGGGALAVKDNYLYANDYFSGYSRADAKQVFHTIDISAPASPTLVCTTEAPQTGIDPAPFDPWGNFVDGNYLFVHDDNFLQKYNIATGSNPTYVTESYFGPIGTDGAAYDTINGYAFMGMMQGSSLITVELATLSCSYINTLDGSGINYAASLSANSGSRQIAFVYDGKLNLFSY